MIGHATMKDLVHATMATMYSIRPIVVLPDECPHSRSMYEMRNIYEDRRNDWRCHRETTAVTATTTATTVQVKMPDDVVTQVNHFLQTPLPEYKALEARQEKILNQLAELKKQVSRLCYFLKQSNEMDIAKDSATVQKPVFVQLLLNVNPSKPPYSILALQKLWKDTNFKVIPYIHSTATSQIPIVFPQTTKRTTNIIELTLIWKEVSNMEIITNMRSYPIQGEVNFLRYVSRSIESHNYESTCLQPHTLDFALDIINLLHNEQCIENGLVTLANEFEKWSCKGGFNIVDIAVWSLIKQFPGTNLPPILRKWYALCEAAFTEEI